MKASVYEHIILGSANMMVQDWDTIGGSEECLTRVGNIPFLDLKFRLSDVFRLK